MSNLDLEGYDSVLLAASSYSESAEASDARTLTGYELLRAELQHQCPDASKRPKVVLEVSHPATSRFVTEHTLSVPLEARLARSPTRTRAGCGTNHGPRQRTQAGGACSVAICVTASIHPGVALSDGTR